MCLFDPQFNGVSFVSDFSLLIEKFKSIQLPRSLKSLKNLKLIDTIGSIPLGNTHTF